MHRTPSGPSIGIEWISVLGMPPVEFARLAGELGCSHLGIGLEPGGENPHGYPLWSLRDDKALRADFRAALADSGVGISVGEGFLAWPGKPASELAADLDIMAELGAPGVNVVSLDPDLDHACAVLGGIADLAQERGMATTLEFLPGIPLGTLAAANSAVERIARPSLRLLIDAMHIFRSGAGASDVAALRPDRIGYLQLCDVPMPADPQVSYGEEARYDRRCPGEGDLPLLDLLRAMPDGHVVGLEVPQVALARAGVGPRERLAKCVAATRALVAQLPEPARI